MAIVGGGVVGTEFASLFSRFGCQVTLIEMSPQILPSEDPECVTDLIKVLKKSKVEILTGAKLESIDAKNPQSVTLKIAGAKDALVVEKVLISIGRAPVTDNLGLEAVGVTVLKNGCVKVNERYHTGIGSIYAVGDIIETPALAHTASAEAMHAVEVIAGHHPR